MFGLGWQELLIVLLVGGVIYMLFFSAPVRRRLNGVTVADEEIPPLPSANAEAILEERFARGEIDAAEFEAKRAILRNDRT
jgi:uncharacterized membrane protein